MSGPAVTKSLPVYEQFRLDRYHIVGITTLLGTSLLYNYVTKKPRSSGILRHGLAALAGYYGGEEVAKFVERRRKMRVLILEDYISRHPEDFPKNKPKKYGDVLMEWVPRR